MSTRNVADGVAADRATAARTSQRRWRARLVSSEAGTAGLVARGPSHIGRSGTAFETGEELGADAGVRRRRGHDPVIIVAGQAGPHRSRQVGPPGHRSPHVDHGVA